jgi:hypothetical protein
MMPLQEFIEQDRFCRKNNVEEGCGCKGCPGENDNRCADWLINEKNIGCYAVQCVCDRAESDNEDARD